MTPTGALVQGTNGIFYGTTQYGGTNGNGTIFQVTLNGTFASVYSFSALSGALFNANSDGASPNGLTLGADGNFYGTTLAGGANGAKPPWPTSAARTRQAAVNHFICDHDANRLIPHHH